MAYPYTHSLIFPLENYKVNSYKFLEKCSYKGKYWGIHLGDDCNRPAGTPVKAIGKGKVVYSAYHPGTKEKPNWGNIIIIAHKNPKTGIPFFSLYAHLGKRFVEKRDKIVIGQVIGIIGKVNTPENGWWEDAHLHFAIYVGPWRGHVIPGYYHDKRRTKLGYWKRPSKFICIYRCI